MSEPIMPAVPPKYRVGLKFDTNMVRHEITGIYGWRYSKRQWEYWYTENGGPATIADETSIHELVSQGEVVW